MNEAEFASRIRQALNEGAERVDYRTVFKLEQARQRALARQRHPGPLSVRVPALQPAAAEGPANGSGGGLWAWLRGAGIVVPLVALALGIFAINQWQDERELELRAALDFAVLLDEGPLDAYADKGFGVLLQSELQGR